MLQDLIQADSDRVDLGLTRESLELYQNYSDLQAKTIERQTMRYETAQALLYEITDQRDSLERELLNCNKEVTKVKKSRRGWIAATFTSLTLLFLGQPSRQDIIASIQRTDTRHVLPPGWQYR